MSASVKHSKAFWSLAIHFVLFLTVFASGLAASANLSSIEGRTGVIRASLKAPDTQWIVLCGITFYFILFAALRICIAGKNRGKDILLALLPLCGISLLSYLLNYSVAAENFQTVVFITAVTLGQGIALLTGFEKDRRIRARITKTYLFAITLMLAAASVIQVADARILKYRGHERLMGMWNSPNTFGLLMGVGAILAVGLFLHAYVALVAPVSDCEKHQCRPEKARNIGVILCLLFAVALFLNGLIRSYSRGAWVGVILGLLYLFFAFPKRLIAVPTAAIRLLIKTRFLAAACIVFSALFGIQMMMSNGKHIDHVVLRRTFTSLNLNDFSWRNRVTACEGELQEIGDNWIFGLGCREWRKFYEQFYLPAALESGGAVQNNDYLCAGAAWGLPALLLLLVYISLSFSRKTEFPPEAMENCEPGNTFCEVSSNAICRAAVIVLLIGFCFDNGLFEMALATPFWILLELGTGQVSGCSREEAKEKFNLKLEMQRRIIKFRIPFKLAFIITFSFLVLSTISVGFTTLYALPGTLPMLLRNREARKQQGDNHYLWIPLRQTPKNFLECVWISEDNRFFEHHGFDWTEIRLAWAESRRTGIPARGASTITQQCARSVFLWQGRSWARKSLEAYYTFLMELMLPKKTILELYVNAVEFGDGIYGLEAAAQHYYHKQAKDLTREEAAMLVAIMPKPREWDPLHPNERVLKRQKVILDRSANVALPIRIGNEGEHSGEAEGNERR